MADALPGSRLSGIPLGGWRNLSYAGRRLLLLAGFVLLAGAAAISLIIWQLRQSALSEARQNVATLGLAIAEQTSRSMQAGHLVLEDMRRRIAEQGPTTVQEFKAQLGTEGLFRFLKDRADFLPQIDAFTVIAADGKLVNFSRQWPPPPTDLSDRDYLAYFRTHDTREGFVSEPVRNRGTGMWTSYIVRRINAPSGEFIGMVLAAVDLDYFRDFFKVLTDQAQITVTLLRADGTALTSFPTSVTVGDVLPATSPWFQMVGTGRPDVFETAEAPVAGARIVSVNPLKDYPFVINVSISRDLALADWRRIGVVAGLCSLLAAACGMLLIRAQLLQFEKLARSERLLAERNTTLEATERTLRDQTDQLSQGRAVMAEQSATLVAALRHTNQGILMVDAEGRVVVCNERAMAMLDLPPELIAARPSFDDLIAFQQSTGEFSDPSSGVRAGSFANAVTGLPQYERTRPNGTVLEVQTVPMQGGGLVRTYTDITERRRSAQQVQFLAHHDALTGLFNRTAFHERFGAMMAEAARRDQRLAVFYLDLDGFKAVNDTHGHAIGDQLLTAVAGRLKAAVRDTDVVARMGGDEFAIIQAFMHSAQNVGELAGRMLQSVGHPFRFGQAQCSVGVSIGVALFPDHARDAETLLHDADTALYRAKVSGKRMFCVFDPALDDGQPVPTSLQHDLAQAVAGHQLRLEYQPIVEAGTLAVKRFEALVRWAHPTQGDIPPTAFIPVAERSGLIVPIGLWVLETACAAATAWPPEVEVSVNLSPVQFARGDLAQEVEQIMLRTGLPPHQLNLEITEGVLLENTDQVLRAMARLRQLGVRFSLDDFGTAYAGLTYLRRFTFDVLKIDKSFVQDAALNPEGRRILGAIQALGDACNMQVVAEGVETEAELAVVRDLRCDHIQGYLVGRPSTVAQMDKADAPLARSRLTLVPRP